MLRLSRIVLGTLLILLGVIGFFLPVLQGWLFVGLGAMLLYRDVPYARRMAHWLKAHFPRIACVVADFKNRPFWRYQAARMETRREEKPREPEP